jgi:transposase
MFGISDVTKVSGHKWSGVPCCSRPVKKKLIHLRRQKLREYVDQLQKVVSQVEDLRKRGAAVPVDVRRRQDRLAMIVGAACGEFPGRSALARGTAVSRSTLDLWLHRASAGTADAQVTDSPRSGRPLRLTMKQRKTLLRAVRTRTTRKRHRHSLADLAEMYDISRMTLWRLLCSIQRRDPK